MSRRISRIGETIRSILSAPKPDHRALRAEDVCLLAGGYAQLTRPFEDARGYTLPVGFVVTILRVDPPTHTPRHALIAWKDCDSPSGKAAAGQVAVSCDMLCPVAMRELAASRKLNPTPLRR